MNILETSFISPDMYMCAFFKAKGMKLLGIKRSKGGRVFFEFEESENRPLFTREYFNNGSIGISDFKSHLNDLKILLRHNV